MENIPQVGLIEKGYLADACFVKSAESEDTHAASDHFIIRFRCYRQEKRAGRRRLLFPGAARFCFVLIAERSSFQNGLDISPVLVGSGVVMDQIVYCYNPC